MSKTVISVENLSKSYSLGQIGTGTITNDLKVWAAKVRGKPNPFLRIGQIDQGNKEGEILWALTNRSFAIVEGQPLRIIVETAPIKS